MPSYQKARPRPGFTAGMPQRCSVMKVSLRTERAWQFPLEAASFNGPDFSLCGAPSALSAGTTRRPLNSVEIFGSEHAAAHTRLRSNQHIMIHPPTAKRRRLHRNAGLPEHLVQRRTREPDVPSLAAFALDRATRHGRELDHALVEVHTHAAHPKNDRFPRCGLSSRLCSFRSLGRSGDADHRPKAMPAASTETPSIPAIVALPFVVGPLLASCSRGETSCDVPRCRRAFDWLLVAAGPDGVCARRALRTASVGTTPRDTPPRVSTG